MSFCGRVALSPDMPVPIERMLRTATMGNLRSQRRWAGDGAALGVADGASVATGPGGRAAILDGQVHNRAELAAALGLYAPDRLSDAALILAAHARFGDDTPERVIGDYALAVWDGAKRRALLAVDPGGMRPLLLHARDGELRFASEARALLAEPDVDRGLDEVRMAHWLAIVATDPERSFHAALRRVPPGGRAIWASGKLTIERWWRPERLPMLRLANHADYAAAVRERLEEAVRCRIAGDARVGSHLSGGLDSATVTAIAARQLAAERRPLTAFTAVPAHPFTDQPGGFGDEWPHAAAVAATLRNVEHVAAPSDDMGLIEMLELREPAQDTPLFNIANSVWGNAIERMARDRGITVLLTGAIGNMSFSYDGAMLVPQLVRQGRFAAAIAATLALRRTYGARKRWIAGHLADAILPRSIGERLRRALGRGGSLPGEWSAIDRDFLARVGRAPEDLRQTHAGDGRALRVAVLRRTDSQGEFAQATRRLYGVDTRDPTADRRLLELCLAIPEEQFVHQGLPRAIARTATADLLPPVVRGELRKGRQAIDWAHGFEAALPQLQGELARLRASRAAPGWIDLDRVGRALDGWPGVEAADQIEYLAVTRAMAAGRFVRRSERGNA